MSEINDEDNEILDENSVELGANALMKKVDADASQELKSAVSSEITQTQQKTQAYKELNKELEKTVDNTIKINELLDNAGNVRLAKDPVKNIYSLKDGKKSLYSASEWLEMISRENRFTQKGYDGLSPYNHAYTTGHLTDDGMLYISQRGSVVDGFNISKLPGIIKGGSGYKVGEIETDQLEHLFKILVNGFSKEKGSYTSKDYYFDSIIEPAYKKLEDSIEKRFSLHQGDKDLSVLYTNLIRRVGTLSENVPSKKTYTATEQDSLNYYGAYEYRLKDHRSYTVPVNQLPEDDVLKEVQNEKQLNTELTLKDKLQKDILSNLEKYKGYVNNLGYNSDFTKSQISQIEDAEKQVSGESDINNLKSMLAVAIQKERFYNPDAVSARKKMSEELNSLALEGFQGNIQKIGASDNNKQILDELKNTARDEIQSKLEEYKKISTLPDLEEIKKQIDADYLGIDINAFVESAAKISDGASQIASKIEEAVPIVNQSVEKIIAIQAGVQAIENQVTVSKSFTGTFSPLLTGSTENIIQGNPYSQKENGYWIGDISGKGGLYNRTLEHEAEVENLKNTIESARTIMGQTIRDSIKRQLEGYNKFVQNYFGTLNADDNIYLLEDKTDRIKKNGLVPVSKSYGPNAKSDKEEELKNYLFNNVIFKSNKMSIFEMINRLTPELEDFKYELEKENEELKKQSDLQEDIYNKNKEAMPYNLHNAKEYNYTSTNFSLLSRTTDKDITSAMREIADNLNYVKNLENYLNKGEKNGLLSPEQIKLQVALEKLLKVDETTGKYSFSQAVPNFFKARDNLTDTFKRYYEMDENTSQADRDSMEMTLESSIQDFTVAFDELNPTLKELVKEAEDIAKKDAKAGMLQGNMTRMWERRGLMISSGMNFSSLLYSGLVSKIGLAGTGMVGAVVSAVVSVVKKYISQTKQDLNYFSEIQSLKVRLGTIYGDQGAADDVFEQIKEYAKKSPFGVQAVTEMAVQLKQSGVYSVDLLDTLKKIGDVSGDNAEKMKRVANNYAQIVANGRATTRDLREFANAGIPIYRALQQVKNTSLSDVYSLTSQGEIKTKDIEEALNLLTGKGGTFEGAVEKNAQTYLARKQNLADEKQLARAERGQYRYTSDFVGGFTRAWITFQEQYFSFMEDTYKAYNDNRDIKKEKENNTDNEKEINKLLKQRSKLNEKDDAYQIQYIDNKLDELQSDLGYDVESKQAYESFVKVKDIVEGYLPTIASSLDEAKDIDRKTYFNNINYEKKIYDETKRLANAYIANLGSQSFNQQMDKWKNLEDSLFSFSTNTKTAYASSDMGKREKEFKDKAEWDKNYEQLKKYQSYIDKNGKLTEDFTGSLDDFVSMFESGFLMSDTSVPIDYESLANNTTKIRKLWRINPEEYTKKLRENKNNWDVIKGNFSNIEELDIQNPELVKQIDKLAAILNDKDGNTNKNVENFLTSYNKFNEGLDALANAGNEEAAKLKEIIPSIFNILTSVSGGTSWNSINGNRIDLKKSFIQSTLGLDSNLLKYNENLSQTELMQSLVDKLQKENIKALSKAILSAGISSSELSNLYSYNQNVSINQGTNRYTQLEREMIKLNQNMIEYNRAFGNYGLSIMDKTVDLINRPQISPDVMRRNGWTNIGEGNATVYTSTYTNEWQKNQPTRAALMTPISQDGSKILSPQELENRSDMLFQAYADESLKNSEEFKKFFANEIAPYLIKVIEGQNALKEADKFAEDLHNQQDQYYNGSFENIFGYSFKKNFFGAAEIDWDKTERSLETFAMSLDSAASVTQAFVDQRKNERNTLEDFMTSLSTYTLSAGDVYDIKNSEQLKGIANNIQTMGKNIFDNIFETTEDGAIIIKDSAMSFAAAMRDNIVATENLQESFSNLKNTLADLNNNVLNKQGQLFVRNNIGAGSLFGKFDLDEEHANDLVSRVLSSIQPEVEKIHLSDLESEQKSTLEWMELILQQINGPEDLGKVYKNKASTFGSLANSGDKLTWNEYKGYMAGNPDRNNTYEFKTEDEFVKNRDAGYFKNQAEGYEALSRIWDIIVELLFSEKSLQDLDKKLNKDRVLPLWQRIISSSLNVSEDLWKNGAITTGAQAVNLYKTQTSRDEVNTIMKAMLQSRSLKNILIDENGNRRISYTGTQGNISNNSFDKTLQINWVKTNKNLTEFATSLEASADETKAYNSTLNNEAETLRNFIADSITTMEEPANIYDEQYQEVLGNYSKSLKALDANAFDLLFEDLGDGYIKLREGSISAAAELLDFKEKLAGATSLLGSMKETIQNLETELKSNKDTAALISGELSDRNPDLFTGNSDIDKVIYDSTKKLVESFYDENKSLVEGMSFNDVLDKVLSNNGFGWLVSGSKDTSELEAERNEYELYRNRFSEKGYEDLSYNDIIAKRTESRNNQKKLEADISDKTNKLNNQEWVLADKEDLERLIKESQDNLKIEQDNEKSIQSAINYKFWNSQVKDTDSKISLINNENSDNEKVNETLDKASIDLSTLVTLAEKNYYAQLENSNAQYWRELIDINKQWSKANSNFSTKNALLGTDKLFGNSMRQQQMMNALGLGNQLWNEASSAHFGNTYYDKGKDQLSETYNDYNISEFDNTGMIENQVEEVRKLIDAYNQLGDGNENLSAKNAILEQINEKQRDINSSLEAASADVILENNAWKELQTTMGELSTTIKETFDKDLLNGFNSMMETIGSNMYQLNEEYITSEEAGKNLKNIWKDIGVQMLEAIGPAMTEAGFALISSGARNGNNMAEIAAGIGLVAAGGITSMLGGFADAANNDTDDDDTERLERLRDLLKDIIEQAKTDADYYETHMRHSQALSISDDATSVNDMILTPHGNFSTAPDDYIIATKTPGSLGNGGTTVNVKVIDQSTGGKVNTSVEQKQNSDGTVDIIAYVKAEVGNSIANGDMDDYFTARQSRLQGVSYAG